MRRKCIVVYCVFISSALFASPLLALVDCPNGVGTSFSPPNPHSDDAVTVDIEWLDTEPGLTTVLGKTTVAAGNISFDVILTSPANFAMFPDYQLYPARQEEILFGEVAGFVTSIEGLVGPLAAGGYFMTTSIRNWDPVNGFLPPCTTNKSLIVSPGDASPVIEYYNSNLDHYFLTQSPDETAGLDAGVFPGWARTGQSFLAFLPAEGEGQRVLRFYGLPSAGLDTHFFTFDSSPDLAVIEANPSWKLESVDAFNLDSPDSIGTCPTGDIPVYRLWNGRTDSNHRYTTDPAIKAEMIAKGYIAEGYGPDAVMMCAPTR